MKSLGGWLGGGGNDGGLGFFRARAFGSFGRGLVVWAMLLAADSMTQAATIYWTGGGGSANMNWSHSANWSTNNPPGASDEAIFTHTAGGASAGVVTNIVNTGFTVQSLSYQLDTLSPTSFFHTTQIQSGLTLLATNGLNVGPDGTDGNSEPGKNWTAHVTVTGSGATLQVGQTGQYTANMIVGRTIGAYNTASHMTGKLDLSGLGTFTANLNLLSLGQGIEWDNRGYAELTLAQNNQINVKTIETGRATGHATIFLGPQNTIKTNTFYVNMGKGNSYPNFGSVVQFRSGLTNPVFTLQGLDEPGADLLISANITNATSALAKDTMDLSGGVFNATLDELYIGRFDHTLAGGCQGSLIFDAGTVTARKIILAQTSGSNPTNTTGTLTMRGGTLTVSESVTDGRGVGWIQVDGGSMTVNGSLQVDRLRVGYDPVGKGGLTGSLTVQGGSVSIGTGSETLDIGLRENTTTGSVVGTLNLANASSVTINVGQLRLAHIPTSTYYGYTEGTLILPTTGNTTITATSVTLGDTPSTFGGGDAKLQLGSGTTTIRTDQFYFGRRKKNAQITVAPGAVLELTGKAGSSAKANLYIGYNDVHTSGDMSSTMDLTGATFNANLDNLFVGYHYRMSGGSGSGTGVLTFTNGVISVNTVYVGRGDPTQDGRGFGTINMKGGAMTAGSIQLATGANTASTGTFNLWGGELTAQSITRGVGTAAFNFTGGILHVGTFGEATRTFNLTQQAGVLAPGASVGSTTIYGNYSQASAGILEIEIASLSSYDTVTVYGTANLQGTLLVKFLNGFAPGLGDTFPILYASGGISQNLTLAGAQPPNTRWLLNVVPGQGDWQGWQILQLQAAVPEPATVGLLTLGLVLLAAARGWAFRRQTHGQ
ncbi:MAG: PEP-CTERM sorting domain-containing protein [Thermoguttaceae bacterium]|nr:PEP-CTERM sorting domain-containing protein [Thermoguttaceae bacterium]MDW8038303.1 PEP-CTERM sorting domain-containing protein [Thermoguttaceae bacterium]